MKTRHVSLRVRMALLLANHSQCIRRQHGAQIIDPKRNTVISDGYNGSSPTAPGSRSWRRRSVLASRPSACSALARACGHRRGSYPLPTYNEEGSMTEIDLLAQVLPGVPAMVAQLLDDETAAGPLDDWLIEHGHPKAPFWTKHKPPRRQSRNSTMCRELRFKRCVLMLVERGRYPSANAIKAHLGQKTSRTQVTWRGEAVIDGQKKRWGTARYVGSALGKQEGQWRREVLEALGWSQPRDVVSGIPGKWRKPRAQESVTAG